MKRLYLLMIALTCAVCVNAESKTAVFDFAGNPWGHALGSGNGATAEAGDPTLSETNVTDLATLGNKKAYALHALTGEGFWCYNPEVHTTNVAICGVTDHSYQGSVGNAAWEAPFDPANPNHQWQILTFQDKHYIYNLGAKKYIALTGGTYVFTDTPTAMEFRVNAETETVNGKPALTLGGTFSIRPLGGGNTDYTCICTKNADNPLKFWTYNDHGGPILITEIENVSDDAAITGLEEAVAQQERTAEWNALLAAAKAEYNANSSYTIGDNIIADPTWFSSPHTCPAQKEPNSDITKLTDGDCKTYWHTDWSSEVAPHTHYLQVNLPEAIAGLTQMTMGRRDNNGSFCDNDNPVRMSVEFSADGESFSEPTYFDTPFTQTIEDPYVKVAFNVPEGTKYLRFYSEKNNGSLQRGYWHCGEFQLNPATLDPNCPNAQNAEVAEEFGLFLEQCDEKDPATIADAHIAILKATMANYHFETYLYTAAELNALENNVKAKVGEVEVVYANGLYNYIQDATGTALLYATNSDYQLTAGDKVQGLVVVGSPYNGLPEVKPISEFADLTIIPNAEYTFAPAEATEVPTAEGVNQIWKYTGVQAKAAAAFTTVSASNMTGTWQETDLTFRNAFKHLETTFEEGKYYTIVAATAVYNGNVQLYVISTEEETTEPTNYDKLLEAVAQLEEICAANQVDITGYDEEGYPEFTSLAGKVGYKPEVALYSIVDSYDFLTYFTENEEITDEATFNAAYAEYYEVVGEFWKDFGFDTPLEYELSYVDDAFELYSMAALCMPEAGKFYTIRNANKFSSEEDGDKEYSYYFTTTTEGALGLKSMLEATVEHEDIWQADEFTYSESEARYTFKNVVTGTYLGHSEGNSLTLLAEAGQSACFYLMAYNAEIPVYGTLGMQYNNGDNEYRWSTIDMREPGAYNASNNPNFDNTYSSFVWIEEVEGFDPETVGLATVIAPATSERIYNLQGQLQNRMHRGINIRSGKKVMK